MTLSEERGSFDHVTFLFQYQDLLSSTTLYPFLESNLKYKTFQMKIDLFQILIPTHISPDGKFTFVRFRLRTCLVGVFSFYGVNTHCQLR